MNKKMKIPEKINILGRIYKIIIQDESKSGNSNLGTHWGKRSLIYLNKDQEKQALESTLVHEIIEAINYLQGLELKHRQVSLLETAIYQILKDNGIIK